MSWFPFPANHGKISRDYIEYVGEKFADLKHPGPVDIELKAEKKGYTMDYQLLSHNYCYLGMAVFETTNKIPIYDEKANCAQYYYAKKNTIIIDNRLLEQGNENRLRFTVAHESGHLELHPGYYSEIIKLLNDESKGVLCRSAWTKPKKEDRSIVDYLEIQANRFAAAVLMPRTAFLELVNSYYSISDNVIRFIDEASKTFIVSPHAVCIRLSELQIMNFSYDTYCDIKRSAAVR